MSSRPPLSRTSLRAASFALLDPPVRRAVKGLLALHQGLWLGLLDRRRLEQLSERQYRRWPRYSDPEYNRGGLWPWEQEAVDAHFDGCRSVLVAATGGGREQLALAQRGFETTGFDCLEALLPACRELLAAAGVQDAVLLAPPSEVPPDIGGFDAVLVGWGAYTHIPGRDRRVRFLAQLRQVLPAGGPLLLSFMTREKDSPSYRAIATTARLLQRLRLDRRRAEIGDTMHDTFDHHFTREEVEAELAAAGFDLVRHGVEPYGHAVGLARPGPGV